MGFWTRGIVAPAGQKTASDDDSPQTVADERPPSEIAAEHIENPAINQAVDDIPRRLHEVGAVENPGMPPDATVVSQEPRSAARAHAAPEAIARRADDLTSWGLPADSAKPSPLGDGFSLRTAGGVRHVSAEVLQPARAWFATATAEGECTTGSCPLPVARLDRRLNTALDWSPTPQAAAEQAEREGKLVFLIHVSGNFAQSGFT
jgi:hypothetical protein